MLAPSLNKTTKTKKESLTKQPGIMPANKQKIEPDRKPSIIASNAISNKDIYNYLDSKAKQISINLYHTAGIMKKISKSSPVMNYGITNDQKAKKSTPENIPIIHDKQNEIKQSLEKKNMNDIKPSIIFKR